MPQKKQRDSKRERERQQIRLLRRHVPASIFRHQSGEGCTVANHTHTREDSGHNCPNEKRQTRLCHGLRLESTIANWHIHRFNGASVRDLHIELQLELLHTHATK